MREALYLTYRQVLGPECLGEVKSRAASRRRPLACRTTGRPEAEEREIIPMCGPWGLNLVWLPLETFTLFAAGAED